MTMPIVDSVVRPRVTLLAVDIVEIRARCVEVELYSSLQKSSREKLGPVVRVSHRTHLAPADASEAQAPDKLHHIQSL